MMDVVNLDNLPNLISEWIEIQAAQSGMDAQLVTLRYLMMGICLSQIEQLQTAVPDELWEQEKNEWRNMMAQIQ